LSAGTVADGYAREMDYSGIEPDRTSTSVGVNWLVLRTYTPFYSNFYSCAVAGCIIDKGSGYGVVALHCRLCVGFCLSSLRGCAYRYHMHFYCFQLDFAYALSKS